MSTAIVIFTLLFTFLLTLPLLLKSSPKMSQIISDLSHEYEEMDGRKKAWRLFVSKVEPYLGTGILLAYDRLLRLAGRPLGLRAVEMIVIQVLMFLGLALLATQTPNTPVEMIMLAILAPCYLFVIMFRKKNNRQFEASESIRYLKRRFASLLNDRVSTADALRDISDLLANDFGNTLKSYVDQIGERPVHVLMAELRQEYEVRELDDFCVAIELSDQNSSETLLTAIQRQIKEEDNMMQEFIERKREATRPKILLLVALGAAWNVGFLIYFGYLGFHDRFQGGGGFLFF